MTQRGIKQALTERFYSWEDARKLAANDPEVDLSEKGPAYVPENFVEETAAEEEIVEEAAPEEVEEIPGEKEKEKSASVQTTTT